LDILDLSFIANWLEEHRDTKDSCVDSTTLSWLAENDELWSIVKRIHVS